MMTGLLRTLLILWTPLFLNAAEKNVLFIVADDLNCALACYGDDKAITPNIDRIAHRGVLFNRAYCQQAVCNPSRSSFLTGRRPDATGVDDLRKSFRAKLPDVVTLPQAFLNAGYFTQCVGKIFHNMGDTQDRRSWSVDEYLFKGPHYEDTFSAQMRSGETAKKKAPVTENHDVPDATYRDGRIAEFAADSIDRMSEKGKPFFLAVGFWRPHLPFVAPKRYWHLHDPGTIPSPVPILRPENVPEIALHSNREIHGYGQVPAGGIDAALTRHLRHGYYASVSFLDAQVGKLLDALEESGHVDNTLIVFTSDHGFHIGERTLWGKTTNFELDARVPLIIADPASPDTHGRITESIAELVDLLPTMTELAEVATPPGQHGLSLASVIADPEKPVKDFAVTQHQHPFLGGKPETHWGYSIRTDRWRYTEWSNVVTGKVDAKELYDHEMDSLETKNIAGEKPRITKKLSELVAPYRLPLVERTQRDRTKR